MRESSVPGALGVKAKTIQLIIFQEPGPLIFFFLIRNMPQVAFQGDTKALLLARDQKEATWIFPFGEKANHQPVTQAFCVNCPATSQAWEWKPSMALTRQQQASSSFSTFPGQT